MKKFIVPTLGLAIAGVCSFEPALAAISGMIDTGDNPSNVSQATGGEESVRQIALDFINFFLFFLGLLATAFVIYGGFLYTTSGGEDGNVEKAKKILTYAAIGLLVVLASFSIINSILGSAGTGDRVA